MSTRPGSPAKDLPIHAEGHQRGKQVMVAPTADVTRLVGVDLEDIPHIMACAAVFQDGLDLGLEDWLLPTHSGHPVLIHII